MRTVESIVDVFGSARFVVLASVFFVGCESLTAIRLTVESDEALDSLIVSSARVDGAEPPFEPRSLALDEGFEGRGTISILVPSELDGVPIVLSVDGISAEEIRATGTATTTPISGETIEARVRLEPRPPVDPPDPPVPTCGDRRTERGEACDDGNLASGDGCSSVCALEVGFECTGAECAAVCGDGRVRASEACDDGNTTPGDGCGADCQTEPDWLCDLAAPSFCQRCTSALCPQCGDGLLQGGLCDDGNTTPGDGCNETCTIEGGFVCVLEPSLCFPKNVVGFVDISRCQFGAIGTDFDPFCSVNSAVARFPPPQVILIAKGRYVDAVIVDINARLIATEGATLASDLTALTIGAGADVSIQGLTITGVDGVGGGVVIQDLSTQAQIADCQIGPSGSIGLKVERDAFARIERNLITQNEKGGIKLDSELGYWAVNNVIVRNGAADENIGGVEIKKSGATAVFTNNTVADNAAKSDDRGAAGGIECGVDAEIINSIVWSNEGNTPTGLSERCTPSYSDLGAEDTALFSATVGNFSADPQFVDARYHISTASTSPCLDAADPAGVMSQGGPAPEADFDGEPRSGGPVDVGADEARP